MLSLQVAKIVSRGIFPWRSYPGRRSIRSSGNVLARGFTWKSFEPIHLKDSKGDLSDENAKISVGIILDDDGPGVLENELFKILRDHPKFEVKAVSCKSLQGTPVDIFNKQEGLSYTYITPEKAAKDKRIDNWILSIRNRKNENYSRHIEDHKLVIDMAGIHRMTKDWIYGITEFMHQSIAFEHKSKRVSCPSAIGHGTILAMAPILRIVDTTHPIIVFATCGASILEAEKHLLNSPNTIKPEKGNFLSYCPVLHHSEKECSFKMETFIRVVPHLADWYRGMYLTISLNLKQNLNKHIVGDAYHNSYKNMPLLEFGSSLFDPIALKNVINTPKVKIGGFGIQEDGKRLVVSCSLDNIVRGGPHQAVSCLEIFNCLTNNQVNN